MFCDYPSSQTNCAFHSSIHIIPDPKIYRSKLMNHNTQILESFLFLKQSIHEETKYQEYIN